MITPTQVPAPPNPASGNTPSTKAKALFLRPDIKAQPAISTEHQLTQALLQQLPPTEVVGKRWFSYNSDTGCWEGNDKDTYRRLALAIMHPSRRRVSTAHRILDHLEDLSRTKLNFSGFIKAENFTTTLINTRNKVLRVTPTKIEELDHDMEFRFTHSLAVNYVPGAVWDLFEVARPLIFPDKLDQKLLQYLWANCFIPDARYQISGVLYGEAGSGKDTIMGPFCALFGAPDQGLITHFSLTQICDPKGYFLPLLQFAAVNVCTELNNKQVEDSSIFKTLVAGGALPVRPIYDKPFNMITPCKLLSLSNSIPEFNGGTDAERRRMRFLKCNFKPQQVDVSIKENLTHAHPGTLNWILEGLQELLRMGPAPMPLGGASSQEVHTRFFANNDPLNNFVTTYCTFDREAKCPKTDLAHAFHIYAQDNNMSEKLEGVFFRRLYNRFTNLEPRRVGADGARIQVVCGIRLNEEGHKLANTPLGTPLA